MKNYPSKVLLIQSSSEISSALNKQIYNLGIETIVKSSTKLGISALEDDYTIDTVFIESSLPQDMGLDFLNFIKRTPRYYFLPVIISCRDCDKEMVVRCLELGACDIILLPVEDELLKDKLQKSMSHGKPNVLLVENNELLAGHLSYIMELEGFKVAKVEDAESGLELLKKDNFDVVVSELYLPGLSGMEALAQIKEYNSNLPVILISGKLRMSQPGNILATGADGFLSIPFKNSEINNLLRHLVLRRRAAISDSCKTA